MKKINLLSYLIVVLTLITALVGIFYSTGGVSYTVENIYGESIELFGDGIYKYNSVLKAGVNKGTDLAMLIVAAFFALFTALRNKSVIYKFLQAGTLAGLLYYSSCIVFGVTFNTLFPIYVLLFSCSLFTMIYLLNELMNQVHLPEKYLIKSFPGTAIFLLICGGSVLMWLQFIIPALITGKPLSNIEIYTTEPTFVLDLGIILPIYWGSGFALLKKKEIGYKLAPVLLTFILIIGVTVIGQNIVQSYMGIVIPIQQFIGLVLSFVVLGVFAIIMNLRIFKYIKA